MNDASKRPIRELTMGKIREVYHRVFESRAILIRTQRPTNDKLVFMHCTENCEARYWWKKRAEKELKNSLNFTSKAEHVINFKVA